MSCSRAITSKYIESNIVNFWPVNNFLERVTKEKLSVDFNKQVT